jgi:uncharacterized protein (TIGR03086 family)
MDQLETLEFAVNELRRVAAALDETQMDTVTNCEPWTLRRLTSHALNNQLLWAGIVTGRETVSAEDTMGAVPYEDHATPIADDAADRALAMWRTEGVMAGMHATPFSELPGSTVIDFPTVVALTHAWDISASVGRPVEFPPETIPTISAVFKATYTDGAHTMGLIRPATEPPAEATDTERLMAAAGRTIHR